MGDCHARRLRALQGHPLKLERGVTLGTCLSLGRHAGGMSIWTLEHVNSVCSSLTATFLSVNHCDTVDLRVCTDARDCPESQSLPIFYEKFAERKALAVVTNCDEATKQGSARSQNYMVLHQTPKIDFEP